MPSGPPARLLLKAEPLPLTAIRELSLRFTIDGRTLDMTPPGGRYRNLPCLVAVSDCTPYAVEVDADPALLRSLTAARSVEGEALGIKIKLAAADLAALANFSAQIGLSPKTQGNSLQPTDEHG